MLQGSQVGVTPARKIPVVPDPDVPVEDGETAVRFDRLQMVNDPPGGLLQ